MWVHYNYDSQLQIVLNTLVINLNQAPVAQSVEHSLGEWEVVGLNPGWVIPKTLKMVAIVFPLGAQQLGTEIAKCVGHIKKNPGPWQRYLWV